LQVLYIKGLGILAGPYKRERQHRMLALRRKNAMIYGSYYTLGVTICQEKCASLGRLVSPVGADAVAEDGGAIFVDGDVELGGPGAGFCVFVAGV